MATPAPASTGTWTPPPGRLGNLTPTQEAALAKFRAELRAEGAWVEARHDDATLLRWSLPLLLLRSSDWTQIPPRAQVRRPESKGDDPRLRKVAQGVWCRRAGSVGSAHAPLVRYI
jgi:hypothetical protein